MDAAGLYKRAKRFRELADGMIQESKLARGRKLGLNRQEILEYSLVLINAMEALSAAGRLMENAAARVDAEAKDSASTPREGR